MWKEIPNSDYEVPQWLTKNIAGKKRIWGRIIINYPLKYIIPATENNHNPRTMISPETRSKHLIPKIKKYGMVGILPVTPIGRDRKDDMIVYELLGGDCRYYALKKIKKQSINIQIFEGSEKELAPLRMALNIDPELNPVDEAKYIYEILYKKFGYTHAEIATICSTNTRRVGRVWVSNCCSIISTCIPEVIQAWGNNEITKSHCLNISRNYLATDFKGQLRALEMSKNETAVSVKRAIKNNNIRIKPIKERKPKIPISRPQNRKIKHFQTLKKRYRDLLEEYENHPNKIRKHELEILIKEYKWIFGIYTDEAS